MEIRIGTHQDIPAIVELLKTSLGEGLMPKSETYWRWKHVENPFGPSPVIVAEEKGQLIGVRAFMRWEWTDGKTIFKAIRAVDTAVHPLHQGKGIFTKLTRQLLEQCKEEGIHFVFNTPNAQSRPGYLKMGWQDAGRLPVRILFSNPFRRFFYRQSENLNPAKQAFSNIDITEILQHNALINQDVLCTNYNPAYLRWRYVKVPVAEYFILPSATRELLIFRIKAGSRGTELRVTDYFGPFPVISENILKSLTDAANRSRATFITFTGTNNRITNGFKIQRGPIVTIRDLQFPAFSRLPEFGYWRPSFGDLELF